MPNIPKICFDRVLPRDLRRPRSAQPEAAARLEAVMPKAKMWANGSTLRIRFLGGSSSQQKLVRDAAPEWTRHANLNFQFVDSGQTEIRVAFENDGAWSYVGTDNLDIPQNQATMNFGFIDPGTILHEFGHATGLGHEHQNPAGGIEWNRENVIRDLSGPPNFWDPQTIEHNVFRKYAVDQINGTSFDHDSIMLYAFPNDWTVGDFATHSNDILSSTDKSFIGGPLAYPRQAGVIELPVIETTPTTASISQPGEQDLYTFNAAVDGRYTAETQGATDLVISLFGPNSQTNLIAQDDDSGLGRNSKIVADLSTGKYFVEVRHFNRNQGTGSYSITVSLQREQAMATAASD